MDNDFKIINCTPHAINVLIAGGVLTFKPSPNPVRVISNDTGESNLHGIPVKHKAKGVVENEPKPRDKTYYIVSQMVAQQLPERSDLLYPDALVRDKDTGEIVGTKSFAQIRN